MSTKTDVKTMSSPAWIFGQAQEREFRFLRENRRLTLLFATYTLALAAGALAFYSLLGSPPFGYFLAGVVTGYLFTAGWYIVSIGTGAAARRMGGHAEEWTDDVLGKVRDGILLDGSLKFNGRNIDHVLLTPSGAVVVETKWTGAAMSLEAPSALLNNWLSDAQWAATKVDKLLNLSGRVGIPVHSVLVVWGPEIERMQGGFRVADGVLVGPGKQDEEWLPLLEGGDIDGWTTDAALTVLEERVRYQSS